MKLLQKIFFGLMITVGLLVGSLSTVDAGLSKSVINANYGSVHYQNAGYIAYQITYTNTMSGVQTIRLQDVLPMGLMGLPPYDAYCQGSVPGLGNFGVSWLGTSYTTSICTLQPGQSMGFVLSTMIIASEFDAIDNTAYVQEVVNNTYITIDQSSAGVLAFPYVGLEAVTSDLSYVQQAGDLVIMSLNVNNFGAAVVSGLVLTVTIPNGFEYVSSSLPGTPVIDLITNEITWVLGNISPNSLNNYSMTLQMNTDMPGADLNVGSVVQTIGQLMVGPETNQSYVEFFEPFAVFGVEVRGIPSVVIEKTLVNPVNGHIYPGNQVIYNITVRNEGTASVNGSLIDIVPPQLTGWTSDRVWASFYNNSIVWGFDNIFPGQEISYTVSAIYNGTVSVDTLIENKIEKFIYADGSPVGPVLYNPGIATGVLVGLPNLTMSKNILQAPTDGLSGGVVVYQLTVEQDSPTLYTGTFCITDTLPMQVNYVSSDEPQSACNPSQGPSAISFEMVSLPATVVITGQLNNTYPVGTVVANVAHVFPMDSTVTEVSRSDNSAEATFLIEAVDLSIEKTITNNSLVNYIISPTSGLVYTIAYANLGSVVATGVSIVDVLPSGVVYSGMVSGSMPIIAGSQLAWIIPTLDPGQTGSLSFAVNVDGFLTETVTNTGSIAFSGTDIVMINNSSAISFSPIPLPASFAITKSLTTPGSYISGSQYVFTIQVVNTGATAATGIVLQDILPSVLSYVSSTGSIEIDSFAVVANNTISSSPFTLNPGQTGNITITTALNTTLVTSASYTNTATINHNGVAYTGSTSFTITPPVFACDGFDLGLTINSPLQNPAGLTTLNGQNVTYNYALTNNYAVPVEVVSLVPTWPTGIASPTPAFTSTVVSAGSGLTHSYTSTTIADGLTNLNASVVATLRVGSGQTFTCTSNASLAISQTCGNGFINANLGEQCENHNGQVILALGQTLDSSTQICNSACKIQTTVVRNCAKMIVDGVEKESCVNLNAQPEVPLLSMIKYVNGQDANTVANGVSAQSPNEVTYRVVITNNSPSIAYNVVFSDVVPNGVTYVNNSVSPTTITYTNSNKRLEGNLGTIAPGSSREVMFRARVDINAPTSVTNIATINYTDNTGTPKDPISDPAVIVVSLSAPRCGDGRRDRLEQCDLGVRFGQSDLLIRDYLDAIRTIPSGHYRGQYCDAFCRIVDNNGNPGEIPACWYTDSVISIMKDEYLPIAMELETNNLTNSCNNSDSNGKVVESSISCTFKLYGPGDEQANRARLVKVYGNGCSDVLTTRNNVSGAPSFVGNTFIPRHDNQNTLFRQFSGPDRDPLFVEKPRLTDTIKLTSQILGTAKPYGEYKLSLENIEYDYCQNNRPVRGTPYARVCRVNVAVTDHYLMQRGSVSSLTNSRLEGYYDIGGESIFTRLQLNQIDRVSRLDYANLSTDMEKLTKNLIIKYEKLAQGNTNNNVKKVPGKDIYFVSSSNGFIQFRHDNLIIKPMTIIVKGNIELVGDFPNNIMVLATGKVRFGIDEPTSRSGRGSCDTQTIHGIIVAQGGFVATEGYKNDELDEHVRCRYGNLHVKGVLVGNNLENVVKSRRSHLEHWFTFERDGATLRQDDPKVQRERREEIYQGASVYIEQNPSLWRSMPPEADSLLKTLNVARN